MEGSCRRPGVLCTGDSGARQLLCTGTTRTVLRGPRPARVSTISRGPFRIWLGAECGGGLPQEPQPPTPFDLRLAWVGCRHRARFLVSPVGASRGNGQGL
jgi:hypothetical protein